MLRAGFQWHHSTYGDNLPFQLLVLSNALCYYRGPAVAGGSKEPDVQVFFGLFRFVLLGSMIVYCFMQLVSRHLHQSCLSGDDDDISNFTDSDCNDSTETINNSSLSSVDIVLRSDYQGWLGSIPIFVFSILLHQAIPTLTHPVRQKKYLRGYFNAVFATVGLIYLSIGILASLWFRDGINETVTLNWVSALYVRQALNSNYREGEGSIGKYVTRPLFCYWL